MCLKWTGEQDVLTIYPEGDLDMVSARVVKETVDNLLYTRIGVKQLHVNLKGIRFIDSSGLGMLINCYKYMQGRQGTMLLNEASPAVYRLVELSGLKKLMTILKQEI